MSLGIAIGSFLKALFNRDYARRVANLAMDMKNSPVTEEARSAESEALPQKKSTSEASNKKSALEASNKKVAEVPALSASGLSSYQVGAVQALALLQKKGRLIDFLNEDIKSYGDEEVGAAVRSVHEECKEALNELFASEKIIDQEDESVYRVQAGYDPQCLRLAGKVREQFPQKGLLVHPGWRVKEVHLPEAPRGAENILTPAQVEIE